MSKIDWGRRKSWDERIDAAEQRGRFTCLDKWAADQWTTCVLGNNKEFYTDAAPPHLAKPNSRLGRAGMAFAYAVKIDRPKSARALLALVRKIMIEADATS